MTSDEWNAIDKKCPNCNSIIKQIKGINKQNLKRLFWSKPTMQDIIIFILIILCLTMVWMYYNEIDQYKFMYENPEEFCNSYWSQTPIKGLPYDVEIDISKYKENG